MRRSRERFYRKFRRTQYRQAILRHFESLEPRQLLNAAPVANDDAYTVAEDTVLSGAASLLANDTDADNDLLTATLVSGPQNGALNLNANGTFSYTPVANFAGVDTFVYAALDGQGGQDNATVTINVIGENEPPTVNNQTFSIAENSTNGTAVGTVVATDPDAGDVLTFTWSDSSGAFAIDSTGKITVADTSKIDFETKATINLGVSVSDIQGASDTATITINVINANDPPTVVAPVADLTVAEESSPTVINVSGVFADQDQNALLIQVVSDNPALVTPSISGSEVKLTYDVNQFGSANITLTAHDGKGGTASDTFAVSVTNVNDPPIANDETFSAETGNSITANVLANDVDPDGDSLTAFLNSATKNGTLAFLSDGTFTYTPNEKFGGIDTFTYTATDGKTSDTATVTFIVIKENQVPDAKDDAVSTSHNTTVSGNVLTNDIDPDGDPLFATLVGSPVNGKVVLNFDGSFNYLPNGGFVGTDSFTYKASDNLLSDSATVKITVTLPASLDASDDHFTVPEDSVVTGNLLANDIDPEGDKFSLTTTSPPSSGSLSTDPSGNFTYTPLANFFGTDSFTYTIQDTSGSTATATVTLTFGAVNEVDAINDVYSGKENTKLTVASPGVLANDVDPDANPEHKSAIIGVIPASGSGVGGTFDIRADGSFDFTPALGFFGNASFTYTIQDALGAKDTATVTITIEQSNHAPVAKNDSATVSQDSTNNFIAVLANDTDVNGDQPFVTAVGTAANGTVTIVPGNAAAGGGVRYTPNPGFRGTDSFTYIVSDGQGGFANAVVTVTVAPPVNPDAADDFFTLTEDTVLFGNLLANDFDLEGDKLTLVGATAPSSGTLITNSEGNFSYIPATNFVGDASFTYTITDGNGTSDTAAVTIRVTNINDAPDAKDDQFTALPETSANVNVLANDIDVDLANPVHAKFNTDPPDGLRVIAVGTATNGQVILGPGGTVSYIPNDGFAGTDSFSYTLSDRGQDGIAGTSDDKIDTGNVTVTVPGISGVNARNDIVFAIEDSIRNVLDVLKNDVDPEGDSFKVTVVTPSANGIVEIGTDGTNLLYTPDPNFFGVDAFTYTITDSTGASDTATVTVNVSDRLEPPDAKNDVAMLSSDSKNNVINVLANDVDPEGGKLTVTKVTQGMNGTVTISADGANVIYTPQPGFAGSDLFTYTITNPQGLTDTAAVLVTVYDPPPGFIGTGGDDVFYVRRDATGTNLLVFASDTGAGTPVFSAPFATAPSLTFDLLNGDDRLIVDSTDGDPVPISGISFLGGDGNDSLTTTGGDATPGNGGFIAYESGTGTNTLSVQNISARIDSTVAVGGTLDTTVGAGAKLITSRLRQNGLALGDGASVVIQPGGTDAATSVVTGLTIGTGATLDINDNALIIDYTGDSPEPAIRAKILEGRGGSGLGSGTWTGTGITSNAAATANAVDPESRSVGFGDNATLPLGSFTSFRGVAVDSSSILITYTRTGDASLDGIVDDDDVTIVGASFNPSGTQPRWAFGNFDFDDGVDDDDVTLIGAFYDPSAQPLAAPARVTAAGDDGAHAAVFASLGGDASRVRISAAELAAIADEIFAQDDTRKKSMLPT